jgi:hypothetical protein
MTSAQAASEATGIPRRTIGYWMNDPDLAELRHNARDAMAEEVTVAARLALQRLVDAIRSGSLESRDYVLATGMLIDKSQLLTGMATARSETRDITGTISDAELDASIREAAALVSGGARPPADEAEG